MSAANAPAVHVVAAVIQRGPSWLICQRPSHKRHAGLWEFPGGKLHPGEGHHEAAVRELREELGVRVIASGPVEFSRRDPESPFMIDFLRVEIDGTPEPLEHKALAWVTLAELLSYDLAVSDRAYAEHLVGQQEQA